MDDHITYSSNIKRLLNENDLTLEQAAARADIPVHTLMLYVNGDVLPDSTDTNKLAHLFGVPVKAFLERADESVEETMSKKSAQHEKEKPMKKRKESVTRLHLNESDSQIFKTRVKQLKLLVGMIDNGSTDSSKTRGISQKARDNKYYVGDSFSGKRDYSKGYDTYEEAAADRKKREEEFISTMEPYVDSILGKNPKPYVIHTRNYTHFVICSAHDEEEAICIAAKKFKSEGIDPEGGYSFQLLEKYLIDNPIMI